MRKRLPLINSDKYLDVNYLINSHKKGAYEPF